MKTRLLLVAAALLSLARTGIRRAPAPDAFELYVIGESTPAGVPYPRFNTAWLVKEMLGGEAMGLPIRTISLAAAHNSIYPQEMALEEALARRNPSNPGAVLVYSGNNDNGRSEPMTAAERVKEAVLFRVRPLARLIYYLERRRRMSSQRSLETFEYHLNQAVSHAKRHGLRVVLSTVVSNVADIPPAVALGKTPVAEVERLLDAGRAIEAKREWLGAITYYESLAAAHPDVEAYATFRVAKCREAMGEHEEANRLYWRCVEMNKDDQFGRATPALNEVIRRTGKARGVHTFLAQETFSERAPHRVPGYDLIMDGQHPTMAGHMLLASGFAVSLAGPGIAVRWYPSKPEEVFERLKYTKEDHAEAYLSAARWLFSVSAENAYSRERLDRAQYYFDWVTKRDPENFSGWLGLGLVAMARRGLLVTKADLDWLGTYDLYYGGSYAVPLKDIPEIVKKLREHKIAEPLIVRIETASKNQRPAQLQSRPNY
ncbi:MAG: hypothetical protein HY078_13625 [Elusimicrobia bacterium]|nr:hypothetical protein [Elusimicrobiota bacterium]